MNRSIQAPSHWAHTLRLHWRMTRPGFLIITPVACFIGMATAALCGCGFSWPLALATVLLASIAHGAANVINDYEDARNGTDYRNRDRIAPFTGGAHLIQDGLVSEADTRRWAILLAVVLVGGGLLLASKSGAGLLLIGLAGIALGWAYSSPPFKLMSRGVGEVAIAASWWLMVIGADYVQRGHFFFMPAAVGLGYALLVANILVVNGLPDARADAASGKLTLAVRLGPRGTAALYAWLALLAHGWIAVGVWQDILPAAAAWALASLPLSAAASLFIARHAATPSRLTPAIVLTILATVVHGCVLAGALVWYRPLVA